MPEYIVNLHMHTYYSDGHGTHADIARAALQTEVDVVIVTDHNVLVQGPEEYYTEANRRVLMLVGEEVHDQARDPQKSHLLVFGANKELATQAYDPQHLVDSVRRAGGVCFIAHPYDPEAPAVGETDISWEDWQVQGYHGIELWNGLSEFKSLLKSKLHAVYYAYNFEEVAQGPFPRVLAKWDELLAAGRKVAAVGGSDAHALPASIGPLHRILFPYELHFRAINTHINTPTALSGDVITDRQMVLEALSRGTSFVGYDLPHPTRGFRFTAQGKDSLAGMGEEISARNGLTLQIRLPLPVECLLYHNGKVVKTWDRRETCMHITSEPGVYRVEAYIQFRGRRRGWIFSNPIYVRP